MKKHTTLLGLCMVLFSTDTLALSPIQPEQPVPIPFHKDGKVTWDYPYRFQPDNREEWKNAVEMDPLNWFFGSDPLRKDSKLLYELVKSNPRLFEILPDSYYTNELIEHYSKNSDKRSLELKSKAIFRSMPDHSAKPSHTDIDVANGYYYGIRKLAEATPGKHYIILEEQYEWYLIRKGHTYQGTEDEQMSSFEMLTNPMGLSYEDYDLNRDDYWVHKSHVKLVPFHLKVKEELLTFINYSNGDTDAGSLYEVTRDTPEGPVVERLFFSEKPKNNLT
ncbi:hypothetical protein [Solemya elarraichensis gill symbiont]|nr:hypothetical protein [Solemya elarraichensis gill symbiont]